MKIETLEYLKTLLTERILEHTEDLTSKVKVVNYDFVLESVPFVDLRKASTALKEVNRSIRRAENRAARKQDPS